VERRAVTARADLAHTFSGVGVGVGDLRKHDDAARRVARGAGYDGRDDADELALVEGVGLLFGGCFFVVFDRVDGGGGEGEKKERRSGEESSSAREEEVEVEKVFFLKKEEKKKRRGAK